MSITNKEIKHTAKLSQIYLSEEDTNQLHNELNDILSYMDKLSALNTDNIEPTLHVHGIFEILDENSIDELPIESLTHNDIEKNAPDFDKTGFRVPKII